MTTTTQLPAAIDWLVNAAQTSASLGASASAPVVIHDGPPPTDDQLAEQRHLYIGWDQVNGAAGGDDDVQSWPVLDYARTRDEDGTVTCTADAWTGDTAMKTARDLCLGIVSAVELLLRGMPQQGGPGDATMGGLAMWSGVDAAHWYPRQTPNGAGMACVFTITYRARLTTS